MKLTKQEFRDVLRFLFEALYIPEHSGNLLLKDMMLSHTDGRLFLYQHKQIYAIEKNEDFVFMFLDMIVFDRFPRSFQRYYTLFGVQNGVMLVWTQDKSIEIRYKGNGFTLEVTC